MCKNDEWYLIDYGTLREINDTKINDIIMLLYTIMNSYAFDYMEKHKIKFPKWNNVINCIKTDIRYKEIKCYLPDTTNNYILDECTVLIAIVLHYDLYMVALGLSYMDHPELISFQDIDQNVLLYIIQHCITHDGILECIAPYL